MTRLSVNINKVALLRNSRGSNLPDLVKVAQDCEAFGAEGITVHPRPDERHIKYSDIPILRDKVTTEFNIEGNPTKEFLKLVLENPPQQCTLVPDGPGNLTSDSGWDTHAHAGFLKEVTAQLHEAGIRVSIFVNASVAQVEGVSSIGADRIELYTGPYAHQFKEGKTKALEPYLACAQAANELGIGINAGHDLNLDNLSYFKMNIPSLLEVSIGHALICDALYYGLQNTIQMYLHQLK